MNTASTQNAAVRQQASRAGLLGTLKAAWLRAWESHCRLISQGGVFPF
jgi:hypothetical protein